VTIPELAIVNFSHRAKPFYFLLSCLEISCKLNEDEEKSRNFDFKAFLKITLLRKIPFFAKMGGSKKL